MAEPSLQADPKLAELAHLVSEIRERVRERHAATTGGAIDLPLPDLTPLLHARDAAQAKVAAIGSVNPRPGGLLNGFIQGAKRNIARGLGWFVRDQVDFNREMLRALNATLDALDESNRTIARLSAAAGERLGALSNQVQQVSDLHTHWQAWRTEWEHKLVVNEAQFARSTSELQHAFQHRVTIAEENFRNQIAAQHRDYLAALEHATGDIQKRLWDDLARIRTEFESLIHHELRLVRQRGIATTTPAPSAAPVGYDSPEIDWLKFAEKFRGSPDYVRRNQIQYVDRYRGATAEVLDIGCGRGEFLQLLGEADIPARGIEASAELVTLCREQGFNAEQADLFTYLAAQPDNSLGGIFCAQVVEHLHASDALRLVKLAAAKLKPGAVFVAETPNPECLAIFATHFYIDPTHTRPLPPPLLAFYFEEAGFGNIEVVRLAPAVESMPALNDLPTSIRESFFGSLDYACIGIKL
ncbi:MAG: class I SAM-dependent methyltransferase [Acidobacteriota bacterium]